MTREAKILIDYRLSRAYETLDDAKILLEKDKLFSCVNRIYYSMFYSVNALLLTKNLASAKHSGVLSLFNKEFVNKEIVNKELGKFYADMFEYRQKGDYRDLVKFEKEDIIRWLKQAEQFVAEIKKIIGMSNSSIQK
ncbi:MAG: HEPN domain-containing protein [Elusimicrobiota bacterium]